MDFIGFDLGKVSSQVCIITTDGELIERRQRQPQTLPASADPPSPEAQPAPGII